MATWVSVAVEGEEDVEVETGDDGKIGIETLARTFGDVASLRYKNESNGKYRLVTVKNGLFEPPSSGWGMRTYYVVLQNVASKSNHHVNLSTRPCSSVDNKQIQSTSSCSTTSNVTQKSTVYAKTTNYHLSSSNVQLPELSGSSRSSTTPNASHTLKAESDETIDLEFHNNSQSTSSPPQTCTPKQRLTKRAIDSMKESNDSARTASEAWNRLNRTIRSLVNSTVWQGTGGFSRCEGTTKDQAVQNKKLRTGLAGDEHVTKLLGTYVIKGKGFVVLDHSHVMEHIRNCLNSMKKSSNNDDKLDTKLSQMSTDDIDETKDDQQNESDSLKEAVGDMSVALDGVQKDTVALHPQTRSKRKRDTSDKENSQPQDGQRGKKPKQNTSVEENVERDQELQLSSYELEREERIERNKLEMLELGLCPFDDTDLVTIAKAWFPAQCAAKLTAGKLIQEAEKIGVTIPKRGALKVLQRSFAKELVSNKHVEFKKLNNLSRGDVIKKGSETHA